jgi:CHAT domain-containing protein
MTEKTPTVFSRQSFADQLAVLFTLLVLTLYYFAPIFVEPSPRFRGESDTYFAFSDQKNDQETVLSHLVEDLLKALETNDLERYIKLWSPSSPAYGELRERMQKQMATNKFAFGKPLFSEIVINLDKASLLLTVDLRTSGLADDKPLNQRVFYRFSFVREEGVWTIWRQTDAQRDLALALTQAKTEEERAILLEQQDALVNVYLTQDLIDQGKREFYENPKQAAIAFRLSYEVAKLLDLRQSTPATRATVANTLHNLANVARAMGNYGRVLEYEEQALALSPTNDLKVEAFINIGITHALLNNYKVSLEFLQRALDSAKAIANEAKRNRLIGLIYDSMGNVRSLQREFEASLADYRNSLDHRKDPLERAETLVNMGIVLQRQGDLNGAEEQYRASLAIVEGKNAIVTTDVLTNLASVQLAKENYDDSVRNARRASELARQIGMPELQWRSSLIEGKVHRMLRDANEARRALGESISVIESMRGLVGGSEERQRFFEEKAEAYYFMIDLLMAEKKDREAFHYVERSKAKVLLDVLSSGRGLLNRFMNDEEQRQEQSFQIQLATINENIRQAQVNASVSQSTLSSLLDQRRNISERYSNFVASLDAKYPLMKAQRGEAPTIELDETAQLLPDDKGALLEFSVGDDKTHLYVITKKPNEPAVTLSTYQIDIKRESLKKLVEALRTEIDKEGSGFRRPASELYMLLMGRAQKELAGKKTLTIVPDGPLWELPFQALQVMDHYLIENTTIVYAPSLTALREMSRQRSINQPTGSLFAMVNPEISSEVTKRVQALRRDTTLDPLPDPTKQIDSLRKIYGGESRSVFYRGVDASEKRFRDEAGSYQILYLFTHGVLDNENPLRSYVILTSTRTSTDEEDGILEAAELMRINLKADLVILSACNTARGHFGAGEGMIGLAWAVFMAGCPTVVVSQWRVPAASTRELMVEFHRILARDNKQSVRRTSKAEALKRASLFTKRSKPHPLYWAGFVLIGAP